MASPPRDLRHNTNNGIDVERAESLNSSTKKEHEHGQEPEQYDETDNEIAIEAIGGIAQDRGEELEKVHSISNVKSVPNGGTVAWLQVLGAFFLFFNSWGTINTFGSYQTYYETDLLSTSTPSAISWIGSIQAFLLMLVGALTGPIYDAGYFRHLLLFGSFLVVFGQMMLSLCSEYWQVLLAQAFCIGIGTGCLFVPSVAILSTYFTTRLATATGLAASGSSLGGVIYPIILHRLINQIGFRWSTRVIGFIILGTLLIPNLVMKVRVLPSTRRAMLDLPAWLEAPYVLFVLGGVIGFMGLYCPFFYIESYATAQGIADSNLAFYLLAVINSASIFGRILPNLVADKTGPLNTIVPCALLTGILSLCLVPVRSLGPLVVICVLYGFFSGTFVSLPPTILVHLSPDRSKIGTRMGMAFSVMAIGVLVGTPVAGAILDTASYTQVWIFGGVTTVVGAVLMLGARGCKFGWGWGRV